MNSTKPQVQGSLVDLALHTLGWKAFQDLCAQVCEEVLQRSVAIYREAQDGGQDAVFLFKKSKNDTGAGTGTGTGTVQCKFTSDSQRRLKPSDLSGEKKSVKDLVTKGEAETYYFITNMGVDAPVAAKIRNELKLLGVINAEVFGREWISQKIRESARLRALVPRVYGLGDLSVILDERRAEQTRALLGHLIPALSVYVPTTAHRQAVRILKEHGIVLLLGAPATGKSMLAAILATSALDDGEHRCFQVDSPQELLKQWNPHEAGGFYWIDDAFGPNQLREDYVDQWVAMMSKVKTAISSGNRFVLTSRSHIWNAAKRKLATRNHPLFSNNTAVVDVGSLGPEERSQILYNHIKAGNQTKEWKSNIKPLLEMLSEDTNLLPEIARRLGDKNYTGGINSFPQDLKRFVSEPMEFLKETLDELNDSQRAALTLVFLFRSRLPINFSESEHSTIVCDKYCVSQIEIGGALEQLDGTFVIKKIDADDVIWSFRHPTISDALSSLLGNRPDLTDLYLRGAKVEAIMSDTICLECEPIRDAIVISNSSRDLLVSRLLEVEDIPQLNKKLFGFLSDRASDAVFTEMLKQNKSILLRKTVNSWTSIYDERIKLHSRAFLLRILPESIRIETAEKLENEILDNLDSRIFDDDNILSLIPPTRLVRIIVKINEEIKNALSDRINEIEVNADLEIEPEDNFDDVKRFLCDMEILLSEDEEISQRLYELEEQVNEAIHRIENRKHELDEEWEGEDVIPVKVSIPSSPRSLFSDIDE